MATPTTETAEKARAQQRQLQSEASDKRRTYYAMMRALGADRVVYYNHDAQKHQLVPQIKLGHWNGVELTALPDSQPNAPVHPATQVWVKKSQKCLIEDIAAASDFRDNITDPTAPQAVPRLRNRAMLCIPVYEGGSRVGVLQFSKIPRKEKFEHVAEAREEIIGIAQYICDIYDRERIVNELAGLRPQGKGDFRVLTNADIELAAGKDEAFSVAQQVMAFDILKFAQDPQNFDSALQGTWGISPQAQPFSHVAAMRPAPERQEQKEQEQKQKKTLPLEMQNRFMKKMATFMEQRLDEIQHISGAQHEEADRKQTRFSQETVIHSRNVETLFRNFSVGVANMLDEPLTGSEIDFISWIGRLHDSGKIATAYETISHPGVLNPLQLYEMKQHVGNSAAMLNIPGLDPRVARIAAAHHSSPDARAGYPFAGCLMVPFSFRCDTVREERPPNTPDARVPMEAQMLSVCDVFDALAMERVYKSRQPPDKIVETLTEDANQGKLNRNLVSLFLHAGYYRNHYPYFAGKYKTADELWEEKQQTLPVQLRKERKTKEKTSAELSGEEQKKALTNEEVLKETLEAKISSGELPDLETAQRNVWAQREHFCFIGHRNDHREKPPNGVPRAAWSR